MNDREYLEKNQEELLDGAHRRLKQVACSIMDEATDDDDYAVVATVIRRPADQDRYPEGMSRSERAGWVDVINLVSSTGANLSDDHGEVDPGKVIRSGAHAVFALQLVKLLDTFAVPAVSDAVKVGMAKRDGALDG